MKQSPLKGRHIVLGITGSIAAYKACSLIRLLVKAGAEVQVVITPAGREFITLITLSALTSRPVISEFFAQRDGTWHSHVSLGLWADAMVVAPATAATIAKMATGVADNMLITTYLSMKAPVFVAPAMDLDMYAHPTTQRNLDVLRSYGNQIIEPAEGELASHLVGKGRMEEPEQIFAVLEQYFDLQSEAPFVQADLIAPAPASCSTFKEQELAGRKVLITAGPTREAIDAVRYISNYSSGKMGYALAEAAAKAGAEVVLVSGPVSLKTNNPRIRRIDVTTADEMYVAATEEFPHVDAAILCAAVADYKVAHPAEGKKLHREETGTLSLVLEPTRDIAAALGQMKTASQRLVGFALETDHELEHAQDKLQRKRLDLIVLNSLRDAGTGFGVDTNKVTFLTPDGTGTPLPLMPKEQVAEEIIRKLAGLFTSSPILD